MTKVVIVTTAEIVAVVVAALTAELRSEALMRSRATLLVVTARLTDHARRVNEESLEEAYQLWLRTQSATAHDVWKLKRALSHKKHQAIESTKARRDVDRVDDDESGSNSSRC